MAGTDLRMSSFRGLRVVAHYGDCNCWLSGEQVILNQMLDWSDLSLLPASRNALA
jgi:hypothetical protein